MDEKPKPRKRPITEVDKFNATSDDFQEDLQIFRVPKRSKLGLNRPKRETAKSIATRKQSQSDDVNKVLSVGGSSKKSSPICVDDDDDLISTLETSLHSETEKICPSCKYIMHPNSFEDHFVQCIQRFKSNHSPSNSTEASILPCPVCFKSFESEVTRQSHIKSCSSKNGLTVEQLLVASKLLEKQHEERKSLGLPPVSKPKVKKAVGHRKQNDPELNLAVALSRSLVQNQTEERQKQENDLLSLGAVDVIQEERRKIKLPEIPDIKRPEVKSSRGRKKGTAGKIVAVLETRTQQERERIISEKVASLLVSEEDTIHRPIVSFNQHQNPIKEVLDKESTLWNLAHSNETTELKEHYVDDLEAFIKPASTDVGILLKHFSQIPGRLNYTMAEEPDEASNDDGNNSEASVSDSDTSIVDAYRTQLILAELAGSQDLAELSLFKDSNTSFHCDDNMIIEPSRSSQSPEIIDLGDDSNSNEQKCNSSSPNKSSNILLKSNAEEKVNEHETHNNSSLENSNSKTYPNNLSPSEASINCNDGALDDTLIFTKDKLNSIESSVLVTNPKLTSLKEKCLADWSRLLESGEHHDVIVNTNSRDLKCHQLVFKVRCPAMMEKITLTNTIDLKNFSSEAVLFFLVYLYSGNVSLSSKHDSVVQQVIQLADSFMCRELSTHLNSLEMTDNKDSLSNKSSTECLLNIFNGCTNKSPNSSIKNVSEFSPRNHSPDMFEDKEDLLSHTLIFSPYQERYLENKTVNCQSTSGYITETKRKLSYENENNFESSETAFISSEVVSTSERRIPAKVVDLTLSSEDSEESLESKNLLIQNSPKDLEMSFEIDELPLLERITNSSSSSHVQHRQETEGVPPQDKKKIVSRDNCVESTEVIPIETSPIRGVISEQTSPEVVKISDKTLILAMDGHEEMGPCVSNVKTPITNFKSKHKQSLQNTPMDVTPCPNYQAMVTPELKRELDKYGIRKMSKRKAVTLLLHIYEQMHPLLSDSDADTSNLETPKTSKTSDAPTGKSARTAILSTNLSDHENDVLDSSQTSTASYDCSDTEEYISLDEEDRDEITPSQSVDLETRLKEFVTSDHELYNKILLFEPIWADQLLASVKSSGIKCSLGKLIDFLDNQCVTYRVPSERNKRKKNSPSKRKYKRKKPV